MNQFNERSWMFINYLVHELFEFMGVHQPGWQFMNVMNVSFVV